MCEMCSSRLGRVSSTVAEVCIRGSDTMCPRSSTRHGHLRVPGVLQLLELLVYLDGRVRGFGLGLVVGLGE